MYNKAPRKEWMVRKTSSQLSTDWFLSFFGEEKHTYLGDPTSQNKPAPFYYRVKRATYEPKFICQKRMT